jgi:hypothetical protein
MIVDNTMRFVHEGNIEDVRNSMIAKDQAAELKPGCWTGHITYDVGRCQTVAQVPVQCGQMTVWLDGRAAICKGDDSVWGDWDEKTLTMRPHGADFSYNMDGDMVEDGEIKPYFRDAKQRMYFASSVREYLEKIRASLEPSYQIIEQAKNEDIKRFEKAWLELGAAIVKIDDCLESLKVALED